MEYSTDAHWRDSARNPRFFGIDAFSSFPLILMLVKIELWTFLLALSTIIFFAILERFKFTIPVFLRWVRATMAGPHRIAYPWWRE